MRRLKIIGPTRREGHNIQSQPQREGEGRQTSSSHPSPTLSQREVERSGDHADPSSIVGIPQAKKVRGETRLVTLWNYPPGTPKIIVKFNEVDQGIGRGATQLSQFLGTIVRRGGQFPLRYASWDKIPPRYIDTALNHVKARFVYPHYGEKWVLGELNEKWRAFKCKLKKCEFDPTISIRDLKKKVVKNVDPDDWAFLVDHWSSNESRVIEERNKNNRAKLTFPHTSGSQSFATLRHEETIKNDGVPPSRARMFVLTHKRKDGTPINAEASDVINQLEEIESQLPEGSQTNATHQDVLSQVLGLDTHGRVRTMGLGVTPSRLWPFKHVQEKAEKEDLKRTVAELKEHANEQQRRFNQLVGCLGPLLGNTEEFQSLLRGFQAQATSPPSQP